MSDQQQAVLPNPEQAFDHLFSEVHQQVFFNKLAGFGIVPNGPDEARGYLELAGKLRKTAADPAVKAAAAQDSLVSHMNANLDGVLGELGLDSSVKQAAEAEAEQTRREVVSYLAQDPGIYNSVLSLKTAEARMVQETMTAQQTAAAS